MNSSILNEILDPPWSDILFNVLPKYGIDSQLRFAAFIAQAGHETAGFTKLEENLNYSSADRIITVFGKRAGDDVESLVRNPEKLANLVYADRMGNGSVDSGDGWLFRGRGCFHLTGRANYQAFADKLKISIHDAIKFVSSETGAVESACWFWDKHELNDLADNGDMLGITRVINGGFNGIDHRMTIYNRVLTLCS